MAALARAALTTTFFLGGENMPVSRSVSRRRGELATGRLEGVVRPGTCNTETGHSEGVVRPGTCNTDRDGSRGGVGGEAGGDWAGVNRGQSRDGTSASSLNQEAYVCTSLDTSVAK